MLQRAVGELFQVLRAQLHARWSFTAVSAPPCAPRISRRSPVPTCRSRRNRTAARPPPSCCPRGGRSLEYRALVMSFCRARELPFSAALHRVTLELLASSVAWASWVRGCFVVDPWAFELS